MSGETREKKGGRGVQKYHKWKKKRGKDQWEKPRRDWAEERVWEKKRRGPKKNGKGREFGPPAYDGKNIGGRGGGSGYLRVKRGGKKKIPG